MTFFRRLLGGLTGHPTITSRRILVGLAILAGLLGVALYAFAARPWLRTFGAGALFSLGALAVGGFFGFLFGLPHVGAGSSAAGAGTSASPSAAPTAAEAVQPVAAPSTSPVSLSTNLQQVADWLTKLIIGAGLVQLGRFPHAAYVLFKAMAADLGGSGTALAVAGGISAYFVLLGFVVGWLSTYLFLTPTVDRVQRTLAATIEVASTQASILDTRATREELKDPGSAQAQNLRTAAEAQRQRATTAAALYAGVYELPNADPGRVAAMDAAITSSAAALIASGATADQVYDRYRSRDQRQREIALAAMALDSSLLNVEAVINSVSRSQTGNEQYQALLAALNGVRQFEGTAAMSLRAAVQAEVTSGAHFGPASNRYSLAQALLQKLPRQ